MFRLRRAAGQGLRHPRDVLPAHVDALGTQAQSGRQRGALTTTQAPAAPVRPLLAGWVALPPRPHTTTSTETTP